jgi:general secretion pathway protein G
MIKNLQRARRESAGAETDESGFTLIELLIVIVVLGVLAAVVIFSLGGVTQSSAVAACNSDAKTVETGVQAYISQGNPAPTSANAQANLVPSVMHTWPSSTYYSISIDATTAGQVDVTVPTTHGGLGTPVSYDTGSGAVCGTITK